MVVSPVLRAAQQANSVIVRPVMEAGDAALGAGLRLSGFTALNVHTTLGIVRVWESLGETPEGPAMVVLHGLGGSAAEYGTFLRTLRGFCRKIIAVDLPGHGVSTPVGRQGADEIHPMHRCAEAFMGAVTAALDTVIGEEVILLGHSLGGYAAMRYAREGQARGWVSKLIVVSPDGAPFTREELDAIRSIFHVDSYESAVRLARLTWPRQPWRSRLMAPFIWARFSTAEMRYLVNSDLFQPVLTPEQLRNLPAHTCLIFGKREAFNPPHNLEYFDQHLPRTYELCQPDTGHGDLTRAPPELMNIIEAFSAGLAVGEERPPSGRR